LAAPAPVHATQPNALERVFGRPVVLAAIALAIFGAVTIASLVRANQTEPPAVLGTLPGFTLLDQTGAAYGSDQLAGKVWIANFIFTRCPTVCPVFSQKMAGVQKKTRNLGMSVRLVSFSVDPDYDTPDRLLAYAKRFSANPYKWKFLTGPLEQVRITVKQGLKIAMENEGMTGDVPDIIHGTHFVMIDQEMRIRGYYSSDDPDEIDRMVREAALLVNHPD